MVALQPTNNNAITIFQKKREKKGKLAKPNIKKDDLGKNRASRWTKSFKEAVQAKIRDKKQKKKEVIKSSTKNKIR